MSATTGDRSRKRSGAAVRRPDWAADATLAEIIRRILAAGEPQKIVLSLGRLEFAFLTLIV